MSKFAVVTATFNPDPGLLGRQLAALADAPAVFVVDDGSEPAARDAVRALVAGRPGMVLIEQERNTGLAAALNAGAQAALDAMPGCEYLLFLDQDTEPGRGGAGRLVAAAAALQALEPRTALVGPVMVDAETGLSHGVHVVRGWCWRRTHPAVDAAPVRCASVNGSGMVVAADAWRSLGGFDEALFIDHVDTEYSFRASHAGFFLYAVPQVRFVHRMGQRSLRFWLGRWRIWPHRAPRRHYFLFRNAVVLMRRRGVPVVWKAWAALKLGITALVHAIADAERGEQLRSMAAGVSAGFRAEAGRPADPTPR